MMSEYIKSHIIYSIFLFIVVALGIVLALQFTNSKQMQMLVVVMTTFFYVAIGIMHHRENHDVTAKIVVEYILIGSLGMTIAFFFLGAL
ncbi:MAG: hypothetical protein HYV39_04045 [Candidatus Levybacteria bacterium]|nr:hypothetical protein [Candidatus Levybacteria bacterium]